MQSSRENKSIKDLNDLFKEKIMKPNPEYQRGVVWNETQQKKLIDSLFRGYTLPLIYLHKKTKEIAGYPPRIDFEIIDGQQRLTAIHRYIEGAFPLFDLKTENHKAKFPRYLIEEPCEWGGKFFRDLNPELQEEFKNKELFMAMIESDDDNEVRDLFVRLQAGAVLNAQERRDAMPGGMNDFILGLGGKPDILRYPGHEFFKEVMGAKPGSDRGKTRQLAAQVTSLLLTQQGTVGGVLPDVNAAAIDQLYYDNLDFHPDGMDGKRIRKIFHLLHKLLRDGMRPRLRAHDVIHAALLANRLKDECTPSWQDEFASALDVFSEKLKGADKVEQSDEKYLYWSQYGMWTRSNSDRGENIARRHTFYVARMLEEMPSTTIKDHTRQFPERLRELVYFRQSKRCAVCKGTVRWEDAEIHHVEPHAQGGRTTLNNAALVHKECHPKSDKDIADLAEKWKDFDPSRISLADF